MRFGKIAAINHPHQLRRNVCLLMNYFSSCALSSLNIIEESNTHNWNYLELQSRMQNYAASGDLAEALETLNFMRNVAGKPSVYDFNALFHRYLSSGNVLLEPLVQVYIGMKRFGPTPNKTTFNILLNGLMSLGYLRDAYFFAEEMSKSGINPSFTSLSKLLKISMKSGSLVHSIWIFKLMLRLNHLPTEPTLAMFVCMLCKAGMLEEAFSLCAAILSKSFNFQAYVFNPVLWALCKCGKSFIALQFFYMMKKKGMTHNVCSYTALLYGFGRERLWVHLYCCLDQMRSDGCKPNVITYTVIIKFLCDDGRIGEAFYFLKLMEGEGCDPDLVTYNIIIRALCLHDKAYDAAEILQVIHHRGFSPDAYTYTALAGGIMKVGKSDIAYELLCNVFSRNCTVDVVVYNIYLHCLCQNTRSREALSLLKSMKEGGIAPTTVSYNTVLRGFCRDHKLEHALKLLECFEWLESGPDVISFNTVLSAACKLGNLVLIRRVLHCMEFRGVEPDVISLTCLVQYLSTMGRYSECLKLLEYMVCNGPAPSSVTFNILLDKLCRSGFISTAYQIFEDLQNAGLLLDRKTYSILLRALLRKCDDNLIERLLQDMYKQRLSPDLSIYGSNTNDICQDGNISTALFTRGQTLGNGLSPSMEMYNRLLKAVVPKK
ncbi:pentatricopeptide repeat-containing protein At3g53700, chloroplastic-like isoform X1 [Benincasa hispida]|uniref:pentatricopeptide repeat-containing protein At3g53700, chloroplastic-like isoform X1 n=2 Tax=Benincasa hispida TaxID=102211 RepID=UPI00190118DD|nr:pentatricopeptide repeat-containing protein At3g53700, chloroplastic-like isoform X1 [Benincasa hispida]XP_038884342.1 pentatricopeptide repeat-containing protein At3g53700, chloroplastic-like isoform X1 [Benincasa hispida]